MKLHLVGTFASSSVLLLSLPLPAQQPEHGALDPSRGSADAVPEGLSPTDWSSIRGAWEAGRHAAYASGEGFRTRTPGQCWTTEFDRDGATTTDDSGSWTWGLELASWGFEGGLTEVEQAASVSADGGRVSLAWTSG